MSRTLALLIFLLVFSVSLISVSQQSPVDHDNSTNNTSTGAKKLSFKLPLSHRYSTPPPPLSTDLFFSPVNYYRSSKEYYTKMDIGTPPQSMQLHIDTGSSYSWVRCYQCRNNWATCFRDSYFQKENSKSYGKKSCQTCKCNKQQQCIYAMEYMDNSRTTLVMSFETISITQDDGLTESNQEMLNVPLGCAIETAGFQYLDGSLGLGTGKLSFYSYLKDNYGVKMFSYCLLDQIKARYDESDVIFGEQEVSADTYYTPMVHDYYSSNQNYAVVLSEIKVEGEALAVSSFPIKMIVDTGSLVTDLPTPIYNALVRKFRGIANQLAWGRAIKISDNYPCYNIDPDQIHDSSTITFTFQGDAEVSLLPYNIWRYIDEDQAACFAFADASQVSGGLGINILGNTQQQGIRVIIDQRTEDLLGFDTSGC